MREQDTGSKQWNRAESVAHASAFEASRASEGTSQREFARKEGVPRTTLQYWLSRQRNLDASPALVGFFESPDGLAFLHRLVIVLHFVLGFLGPCGLRTIVRALELAGLEPFVANSFGSHQKLAASMEGEIIEFAEMERKRLAASMPPKRITVCEDETFHPAICLVAIEPVSNFLLLETYVDRRDAATWDAAIRDALVGLPVQVIQSTGDEAKALLAHARDGLGAHHSPDLFHVQQEVTRATSVGVAAQVRRAETEAATAKAATAAERMEAEAWAQSDQGRGRPLAFAQRIEKAENAEQQVAQTLMAARNRQERLKKSIQGIGQDYHPVELSTGVPQCAAKLEEKLEQHFAEIVAVAVEANLPERCHKGIQKAHRLVPALVATLAFYDREVNMRIAALELSAVAAKVVRDTWVPAAYLERAARKAQPASARPALRERAEEMRHVALLHPANTPATTEQCARVERVVAECADLFQRASSCVEGRNGQLSLHHHGLHNLSPTRLQALTAVHNYFLTRSDGTTAAQRFFENKPANLFSWLLDHIDMPARPARKRPLSANSLN